MNEYCELSKIGFKKIFLTKGKGVDRTDLTSFELALKQALPLLNLITVSSILPNKEEKPYISRRIENLQLLVITKQVVPVVLAQTDSNNGVVNIEELQEIM